MLYFVYGYLKVIRLFGILIFSIYLRNVIARWTLRFVMDIAICYEYYFSGMSEIKDSKRVGCRKIWGTRLPVTYELLIMELAYELVIP